MEHHTSAALGCLIDPDQWLQSLELRRVKYGGREVAKFIVAQRQKRQRVLAGAFPYGKQATVSSRGRVRKERIEPKAFRFAIEVEPQREINLLYGHSFDKPLASRRAGSLVLADSDDALDFAAALPAAKDSPGWVNDAMAAVGAGLAVGISPGFQVPPSSAVPDAEVEVPEPGNPGVSIRSIRAAVLYELSIVTRPAYEDAAIEPREAAVLEPPPHRRRLWL